jgi:hypothetical protein
MDCQMLHELDLGPVAATAEVAEELASPLWEANCFRNAVFFLMPTHMIIFYVLITCLAL